MKKILHPYVEKPLASRLSFQPFVTLDKDPIWWRAYLKLPVLVLEPRVGGWWIRCSMCGWRVQFIFRLPVSSLLMAGLYWGLDFNDLLCLWKGEISGMFWTQTYWLCSVWKNTSKWKLSFTVSVIVRIHGRHTDKQCKWSGFNVTVHTQSQKWKNIVDSPLK